MEKDQEPTDEWLEQTNETFNQEDVPPHRRPLEAIRRWTIEHQMSVTISDQKANKIFEWFKGTTKPGSQQIGSRFTGSFYFESAFYPVQFPVFFGKQDLDIWKFLTTMPVQIKERLSQNEPELRKYIALRADGLDYIDGYENLGRSLNNSFAKELTQSAHGQLKSTVSALHEPLPNSKSIESARMATEMILKAYLAEKIGLTDEQARKEINHSLETAVDKCFEAQNHSDWLTLKPKINIFPPVKDRYKGINKTGRELWEGYSTVQFAGATVARLLTGNDSRSQIKF